MGRRTEQQQWNYRWILIGFIGVIVLSNVVRAGIGPLRSGGLFLVLLPIEIALTFRLLYWLLDILGSKLEWNWQNVALVSLWLLIGIGLLASMPG